MGRMHDRTLEHRILRQDAVPARDGGWVAMVGLLREVPLTAWIERNLKILRRWSNQLLGSGNLGLGT